jgi:DNA-binding CsgD family transcriptional regulator
MPLHRVVEEYAIRAPRCRTPSELFNLTEAASREFGFPWLAIVHGLWFRFPDQRFIRLDNFGEYGEIFVHRKFYRDDPGLLVAQRTNAAFLWSETPQLLPGFGRRNEAVLIEAGRHGLALGLTQPIGVMGEPHGCCSFACRRELPSIWCRRAVTLIGGDAFREMRRLHGFPRRALKVPRLSPRKLECLRLMASGKTDKQIAAILGVQLPTVRTYMTLLRQDFDAHGRAQLAVEALRCGFIGYDDVLPM